MTHNNSLRSDDLLILVDDQDREIGSLEKQQCHVGDGTLHRAFSILIFNKNGELLIQQRSEQKPLWPLYWSNSCCSHPRVDETIIDAAKRRTQEELGFSCAVEYLYKFKYRAKFKDLGSEHEMCSVFIGYYDGDINPDSDEVAAWRFISPKNLSHQLIENPDIYTPWFLMEWEKIQDLYLKNILKACNEFQVIEPFKSNGEVI